MIHLYDSPGTVPIFNIQDVDINVKPPSINVGYNEMVMSCSFPTSQNWEMLLAVWDHLLCREAKDLPRKWDLQAIGI